jgi:hypothetical protein
MGVNKAVKVVETKKQAQRTLRRVSVVDWDAEGALPLLLVRPLGSLTAQSNIACLMHLIATFSLPCNTPR